MYDTVNQIKSPFTTHVAPNTSTNLTMSFNNQLNTVHNQVIASCSCFILTEEKEQPFLQNTVFNL